MMLEPVKATVYSVWMENISLDVKEAQLAVVEKFLPEGWRFVQMKADRSHGDMMQGLTSHNPNPVTVFLDIDCIPLNKHSLELLAARANIGMLVGAVQRANHIQNNEHLYVGPFCMAFSNKVYRELGEPRFNETMRGDVGEELTYSWQLNNRPVYFLWPTKVNRPLWNLKEGHQFGRGTTYENLFYHEFQAREDAGNFVAKCDEILGRKNGAGPYINYKHYEDSQRIKYRSFESDNSHWKAGQKRFIDQWLMPYKDKKILDVACGDGVGLKYFRELGFADVTGLEFEQVKAERASISQYPIILGDFHEPLRQQFDLIYSSHSLEHAYDPAKVLKNFHDHCKELILVLPYPDAGPIDAHCAKQKLGTDQLDDGASVIKYVESFGFVLQDKQLDNFRESEIWLHFTKGVV